MDQKANQRAVVWSVAGSDSGGGAGLAADLRAIDAFELHGCSVVAAITAQNSTAVDRIAPVSTELLEAQLAALSVDMAPAAIKTGMLGSAENLQVLVRWIDRLRAQQPQLAVVVDPVLRSSTGAAFADAALLHAYRTQLLPRASLITPNRSEAAALLGVAPLQHRMDVERAAQSLLVMGRSGPGCLNNLPPSFKWTPGGLPKVQSCPRRRWSLATNRPTRWATRGAPGISFYAASASFGTRSS